MGKIYSSFSKNNSSNGTCPFKNKTFILLGPRKSWGLHSTGQVELYAPEKESSCLLIGNCWCWEIPSGVRGNNSPVTETGRSSTEKQEQWRPNWWFSLCLTLSFLLLLPSTVSRPPPGLCSSGPKTKLGVPWTDAQWPGLNSCRERWREVAWPNPLWNTMVFSGLRRCDLCLITLMCVSVHGSRMPSYIFRVCLLQLLGTARQNGKSTGPGVKERSGFVNQELVQAAAFASVREGSHTQSPRILSSNWLGGEPPAQGLAPGHQHHGGGSC